MMQEGRDSEAGASRGEIVPLDQPMSVREWAEQLVARARADGIALTGDGGLLTDLMRHVLQTGLEVEMAEHLGREDGPPLARLVGMRNLVLHVLTASAIVAMLIVAPAGAAPVAPPAGFTCTGAQFKLFDSWNGAGVLNGAKSPIFSTFGRSYCVTSVTTYHWNNGQGQLPGSIGLGVVRGLGGAGMAFGPWPAAGSAGQGGAQNVNWSASPPSGGAPVVINGTYTCRDSSPSSWAQNRASRGRGFCAVYVTNAVVTIGGVPLPAPTPPAGGAPAPAPAHATCTPTPPSTYLIYPNHVAPAATTRFLLWCNKPASLGYRGAFVPLGVLIYDEASFRNMHYVNGYLRPTSPSLPVRPPIVPVYRILGDQALEVSLPASMQPGVYVPVIVWAKGEVASQNLLAVR